MILLKVLIILFVELLFLWLYNNIICVEVMFNVRCNMVVINRIRGKILKFIGCWVNIVIKIIMRDKVILKLNSIFSSSGGMGRMIMFIMVNNINGIFNFWVSCCNCVLLKCCR